MDTTFIVIGALCFICLILWLLNRWRLDNTGIEIGISYMQTITWKKLELPIRLLLPPAVEAHLGFRPVKGGGPDDIFHRGRSNIAAPTSVEWRSLPVTLTIIYENTSPTPEVTLLFKAPERMEFASGEAVSFQKHAEEDVQLLIDYLNNLPSNFHEPRFSDAESGNASARVSIDHEDDLRAQFERLGLEPNASWEEVKKAYRRLCLKYHPDTLAYQRLPEHVERLVVDRFQDITEAYNILKERHGGA